MAWNVDQIYSFSKELINKAQRGEYTPDAFFLFWNAEQRSLMQDMVGRFQEARRNRSAGVIANNPILNALAPFTKKVILVVTSGTMLYPSDYKLELALRVNGYRVIPITHGQQASVSDSVIDPPSVTDNKYFYLIYDDGIHLLPATVTSVQMDYIADCRDVVWGYTENVSTGLPEYNAGASVQPQWRNAELAEITKRTLKLLGVHFSANDFAAFGQSVINNGN